jgi:S-phase kinase-associated protein 1
VSVRFIQSITEEDFLFELMLAANFLDVPGLLDALAKVVAVRLEGKTAGQIRQEFGIEGDLTGDEVEAIQDEEEWDTLVESLSG